MGQDRDDFSGVASGVNPLAMVTISCSLGDRRSMQMAINVSAADPVEVQNEMLDSAMRLMDRQQARYDLEGLEDKFNVVGMNTRQLIASLTGADVELKTRLAGMAAKLAGQEEGRKEIHDEAYNEHTVSGRRGEFKPKGVTLQKLNAADIEIAKTKAAIEAAPADAAQQRHQLVQTILRNQEDLRLRRKQINDLRGLAGLNLNTEYEDAENAKV